ncbi:hypothetical protein EJ02DRAFT_29820 [Clathrospora elynae]|uniref:Uncharacterized protein n=1 Tax=Clathrospora elynae TaxID=706981 RepID=A0A6A5SLJ7_9PLEO|nr:hypothetical protein EJ02DRAFT_29820 [Clathrospora elynae]
MHRQLDAVHRSAQSQCHPPDHAGQASAILEQLDPETARCMRFNHEVVGFHYDNNDDGHVYSAIVVLGADGNLHLPDLGYKVHVKKGSVVLFSAKQLLHKLDIDENAGADAKQFVLTFWTGQRFMDYLKANKHKEDFYGTSELDDDEALKHPTKDCYIVQMWIS